MSIFYITSVERMVRKGMVPSISTQGKPTEKTGVPQHSMGVSSHVMDGIVRGVARGTTTHQVDGVLKSACGHKMGSSDGMMGVRPNATKTPLQGFGSVNYAEAKIGK
jgi:hypothetical protein